MQTPDRSEKFRRSGRRLVTDRATTNDTERYIAAKTFPFEPVFEARTYNVEVSIVIASGDEEQADVLAEQIAAEVKRLYAYRRHGGPDAVVANATVESIVPKRIRQEEEADG